MIIPIFIMLDTKIASLPSTYFSAPAASRRSMAYTQSSGNCSRRPHLSGMREHKGGLFLAFPSLNLFSRSNSSLEQGVCVGVEVEFIFFLSRRTAPQSSRLRFREICPVGFFSYPGARRGGARRRGCSLLACSTVPDVEHRASAHLSARKKNNLKISRGRDRRGNSEVSISGILTLTTIDLAQSPSECDGSTT